MDWNDFQEWLRQHIARFPGIATWLQKFPVDTKPDGLMPTRREILDKWHSTLRHIPLWQAIQATDELGSDDWPAPHGYGEHPLTIAAICRGEKRAAARSEPKMTPLPPIVDGEYAYRCPICRDTGAITVWHPRTMQAARDGILRREAALGRLYRVSVACANCETPSVCRRRDAITFDPRRMLPAPTLMNCDEALTELETFVQERERTKHDWDPDSAF